MSHGWRDGGTEVALGRVSSRGGGAEEACAGTAGRSAVDMLAGLVLATSVLWLMSTVRHALLAGPQGADLGSPSLKPATQRPPAGQGGSR